MNTANRAQANKPIVFGKLTLGEKVFMTHLPPCNVVECKVIKLEITNDDNIALTYVLVDKPSYKKTVEVGRRESVYIYIYPDNEFHNAVVIATTFRGMIETIQDLWLEIGDNLMETRQPIPPLQNTSQDGMC